MTWWDSAEKVQWWSKFFNAVLAICGLATGVLGVGALVFAMREGTLAEREDVVVQRRIEAAERETATARSEADAASRKLADITTPRGFTAAHSVALNRLLDAARKAGPHTIVIHAEPQPVEGDDLLVRLQQLFKEAGWEVIGGFVIDRSRPAAPGFTITFAPDSDVAAVSRAAGETLAACGFQVHLEERAGLVRSEIVIGPKWIEP